MINGVSPPCIIIKNKTIVKNLFSDLKLTFVSSDLFIVFICGGDLCVKTTLLLAILNPNIKQFYVSIYLCFIYI